MKLKEAIDLANKHQNLKDYEVETNMGLRKIQSIFIAPNNQQAFSDIVSAVLLEESYKHILAQFRDDETFEAYVLYRNRGFDPIAFYELLRKVVGRIESGK